MHGLDTIIALNKRATERCEECNEARIEIEARTPRDFLHSVTLDGKERLLCIACITELQ